MNKVTEFYVFMVLSVITMPTIIFANYLSNSIGEANPNDYERQIYHHDSYSQEEQNQSDDLNSEIIGDRSWETTSSRMNRQAAANNRFNSNQNRNEQTGDSTWETTSSRMNRQAAAANNRANSTWIREEQNRQDSDAAIRRNTQR